MGETDLVKFCPICNDRRVFCCSATEREGFCFDCNFRLVEGVE